MSNKELKDMTLEELESFRGDINEMIKSKKDNTYNNKNIEEKIEHLNNYLDSIDFPSTYRFTERMILENNFYGIPVDLNVFEIETKSFFEYTCKSIFEMIDALIKETGGNIFLSNIEYSLSTYFEYIINLNAVGNKKYVIHCKENDAGELYVTEINIVFKLCNGPYFDRDIEIDVTDNDLYDEVYLIDWDKTPKKIINSINKEIYNFRERLHEFINTNIR